VRSARPNSPAPADEDLAATEYRDAVPPSGLTGRATPDAVAAALRVGDVVWGYTGHDTAELGGGITVTLDATHPGAPGWRRIEITDAERLLGRVVVPVAARTALAEPLTRAWDVPVPTTLEVGRGWLTTLSDRTPWLPWLGWLVAFLAIAWHVAS
jgi:hypothetical protein